MQEVCVRMFEPPENTPLGTVTISIGVETVQGTVCKMHTTLLSIAFCLNHWWDDYTEVTGARFAYFLFFSDTSRRSCFMVEVTQDFRYEFKEKFFL